MAVTNFAALTQEQKTIWSKDLWRQARNLSFINQFAATGPTALVQRVTELTKSEKGARAVLTLVADMTTDGIAGDNTLEGNEEALKTYDQVIQIDQLRNANKHKGRMADQRSVVNFRETSKDVLAYWIADRVDQLAFLTLSGVSYTYANTGILRPSTSQLSQLAYATDVKPLTSNRWFRWDNTNKVLASANTGSIASTDTPTYAMLVAAKAKAKATYMRGVRGPAGQETYHVFMHPLGLAKLKLDPDFLANVRYAYMGQKDENPLMNGSFVMSDGLIIHEFRHVFNTSGAASGSKWGAGSAIDGQAVLLCGAQSLGMADLGAPTWIEEGKDYENQQAISVGKIFGFLNPQYYNNYTKQVETFGVMRIDTAI